MTGSRISAYVLVCIEALTLFFVTQSYVIPAAALILATIGLPGRWRFTPSRNLAGAIILALAVAVIVPRMLLFSNALVPRDAIFGGISIMYVAADLCMLLQAGLLFYVRADDRQDKAVAYPAAFLICGVVAMVSAGVVQARFSQHLVYQATGMAFVIAALVFGAGLRKSDGQEARDRLGAAVQLVLLVMTLVIAGVASQFLAMYGNRIDTYFANVYLNKNVPFMSLGFSRDSRLDSVQAIRRGDNKTVLRVYSDTAPGYLRGAAYDSYVETRWRSSFEESTVKTVTPLPPGIEEQTGQRLIPLHPAEEPFTTSQMWQEALVADAFFLPQDTAYVQAAVGGVTVNQPCVPMPHGLDVGQPVTAYQTPLARHTALTPEHREAFLAVPEVLGPGAHALAASLLTDAPDVASKISTVERYFHTNYSYTFGIQIPPGEEPLNYFLRERPAAHCEYFAAGAVMLLRMGGVPARYVTGFVAVEQNPYGDYWFARNKDAHAWCEAWSDETGWILVEATPAAGVPQEENRSQRDYAWDYAKQQWREFRNWIAHLELREAVARVALRLLQSPVGMGSLLVLALTAALYYARKRIGRRGPRESVELQRLHRLLKQHDRMLKRRSLVREPSETLHAFAARIEQHAGDLASWASWYRRYAAVRYNETLDDDTIASLGVITRTD